MASESMKEPKLTVTLESRKVKGKSVVARVVNCTARYLTVRHMGEEIVFRRNDASIVRGTEEWDLSLADMIEFRPQNRRHQGEATSHL